MSNCTPCTPANDELPIFCDPFPATDTAKRLLVEDEAFCQKALTSPTTPSSLVWDNGIKWEPSTSLFDEYTNFKSTGSTTGRNLVTRFADVVNVKDFGAIGDGVTDDSSAIQSAVTAAGQSKKVYIPSGKYYCASSITSNLATSFSGDGISETILLFNGNGFIITPSNDDGSVEINNIAFHKKIGAVSGTAIKYDGSNQIVSGNIQNRSNPRFYFNNISIKGDGDSTNSGWLNGIVIQSGIHGICDGIHFDGLATSLSNPLSSKAISFEGSGNGAEFIVNNSWVLGCDKAIYADKQEGVFVSMCNFIVVNYGIYIENSDALENPQLNATNCHINANNTCIFLSKQSQANISNNLLYFRESGTSNGVGIGLHDSQYSNIHSNIFIDTNPTYNLNAIVCVGNCYKTYIYNNTIQEADSGVWLQSTSSGVFVGLNNFVNVTQNILNQGSNNIVGIYYNDNAATAATITPFVIQRSNVDSFVITKDGCIEAGKLNQVQSTYIDFHSSGNSANDYDGRIVCNGGSAVNGTGNLEFSSSNSIFSGVVKPSTDGTISLGTAGNRWSVVYAASGSINTSDAREKQQVEELSDSEKAVAIKIKSLIRKFKFNDAVISKGESARIHVGIIAQDVIDAFKSEGLDATKYGILCYDEWDSQEEIKDENGNIIQKYRNAGNRYGIRYEELLAFVISSI